MANASSVVDKVIATVDDQDDHETVQALKRRKPYNAIMSILLFIWPRQRREQVTKELNALKSISKDASTVISVEISDFTSLLWKELNVKPYYKYVNRHKSFVTVGFQCFNDIVIRVVKRRLFLEGLLREEYRVSQDTTSEQIDNHDNSKYTFEETVTYAMRWYPCQELGNRDEDSWLSGLQHHYCNNEHHPEHWGEEPMHWRYIVEAMYDMSAMELERRFDGHTPDNMAELLVFKPQFLERFNKTKQLDFILKLTQYTMEEYCRRTGHKMPVPDNDAVPKATPTA